MGPERARGYIELKKLESARMRRLFKQDSDLKLVSYMFHVDKGLTGGHTTGWLINSQGILPNVVDHKVEIEHTFWFGNSYSSEEGIEMRIPISHNDTNQSVVVYRRSIEEHQAHAEQPLREVLHDIRIISRGTIPEGWRNEFEKGMAAAVQTAYTDKYKTIEFHFNE